MTDSNTEIAISIPSTESILANQDVYNKIKNKAESLGKQADETHVMFIKMDKQGNWIYGEDDDEVDPDDEFIIHPFSYQYGCVAFSDNQFVDEKLVSAFSDDPIPLAEDLEKEFPIDKIQNGDGWKPQHGIIMQAKDGGPRIVYKSSSVGGIRALEKLIGTVGNRMSDNPESLFPVVTLDSTSYKHKKYGKIYTPVINVIGWCKNDTNTVVEVVDVDDEA